MRASLSAKGVRRGCRAGKASAGAAAIQRVWTLEGCANESGPKFGRREASRRSARSERALDNRVFLGLILDVPPAVSVRGEAADARPREHPGEEDAGDEALFATGQAPSSFTGGPMKDSSMISMASAIQPVPRNPSTSAWNRPKPSCDSASSVVYVHVCWASLPVLAMQAGGRSAEARLGLRTDVSEQVLAG